MNMPNFQQLFALKNAKSRFEANHPKVKSFMDEVNAREIAAGTEIAVAVRYPDGTELKTGIRVQEGDLELLQMVKGLMG